MDIRLNNVGIVSDSTITMNGLTVITGKNNSGKTTVGKTLYSLLDAVCNIQQKAQNDRFHYIKKQLENVESTLEIIRYLSIPRTGQRKDPLAGYPSMQALAMRDYRSEVSSREVEAFARALVDELKNFDISISGNNQEGCKEAVRYYAFLSHNKKSDFFSMFNEQQKKAIAILEKLFVDIDKDVELIDYARESINQALRIEFSNQIQPIKLHTEKSEIELYDGNSVFFKFVIANNRITNDGKPVYITSPYKKVYLIDNPFVLDEMSVRRMMRGIEEIETESILNPDRIYSHNDKLKFVLRSPQKPTILEQTVLDHSLEAIKGQIDRIIPGGFEFSSSGEYYIQNGMKLKVSNLATGSKMFSIIKILLEKGEIDGSTMLILDEPEAHLHPQWQNAFAEIMVLLAKELKTNILLTSHSPNFILALDAYMRKHDMANKTNFYQTDFLDNGLVQYHCVNDDLGSIYQDFSQYLSEMKMLRNNYLNSTGE